MSNIIHLSLFPDDYCVVCNATVVNNHLHCLECCQEYLKIKQKQDEEQRILQTNSIKISS